MTRLEQELGAELAQLEGDGLRRSLRVISGAHGARVDHCGRELIMMSSNNYLGLAADLRLRSAAIAATAGYGVGAGASRLIAGNLEPVHRLELQLAAFKRTEAALVFGSGYLANLGTITALAGPRDAIFSDELNHASLIDGCRLAKSSLNIYRHGDVPHLRSLLERTPSAGRRIIVTDSVFSMDGDFAPLREIAAVAQEFGAAVVIDEAHAVGVVGPRGAGLAAQLGLEQVIDVQIGTLSKAIGAYGAYVAGSKVLIDFLVNRARSFIYTTGLPPAIAAAAAAAVEIISMEPERIRRLWDNAGYLRTHLVAAGFQVGRSESPILPLMIGDACAAVAMATKLLDRGVFVTAIRPPTVAPGTARLRLTPTSEHSRADLDATVAALIAAGRELGLIA